MKTLRCLQHTVCAEKSGIGLLLIMLLSTQAGAASLEATTKLQSSFYSKKTVSDLTKRYPITQDDCFKIDKVTGQLIPCETKTRSSGGGSSDSERNDEPSSVKAFWYFNSDYNEQDYVNDPESVITNAYLLSQLSALSYRNPGYGTDDEGEQAYAIAEKLGLNHLDVIEDSFSSFWDFGGVGGESLAYVFYNDYAVFVAFQGSKGWLDWEESNIDFWPYAKPDWGHDEYQVCFFGCITYQTNVVTIHNGFYDAMDIIFADVVKAIEPLLEGRRLWITGHSLGGAVAMLTAFRMEHEHNISVQGVHTFGAPAVGDSDWANVFAATVSNAHRWGVEGDPAPLATQAPMFYHVGFINNLYENGDYLLAADDNEMLGLSTPCLWQQGPQYGAVVRHMSYWPRMHDIFSDYHSYLASLLPDSLPGVPGACE